MQNLLLVCLRTILFPDIAHSLLLLVILPTEFLFNKNIFLKDPRAIVVSSLSPVVLHDTTFPSLQKNPLVIVMPPLVLHNKRVSSLLFLIAIAFLF